MDGKCGDCESGRMQHPVFPTKPCVLIAPAYRPSANPVESDCACYQTWNGAGCDNCPYGELNDGTNVCAPVDVPKCEHAEYASQMTCYQCQQCEFGTHPREDTRDECEPDMFTMAVQGSTFSACGCLERVNDDGTCSLCGAYQVQDPSYPRRCMTPVCPGQLQVRLPFDPYNCGRCQTCNQLYN